MSIYNWQTQPNHWNTIITKVMKMTLLFTPWLSLPKHTYTWSLLITQIWKLISQKQKMKETNGFQILNRYILYITGYTWLKGRSICTCNTHAQRDAQKHCFIYPHTTLRGPGGYQSFEICLQHWNFMKYSIKKK